MWFPEWNNKEYERKGIEIELLVYDIRLLNFSYK